ncbi:MAG: FtsX-like permease family protein [Gemmatimonadetes bacterium]|nr:FtsX-like permease family protein [Gemmatimonadota bacterium]MXX72459.1 FtsX-like permease family protein [Gemmatimonadota bacterium]MYC92268.1 FtsX-like permease family protein [Gemmatimonadota bacterium]MYG35145.1 FtsX-like permease family protein [Gemmatimonadota bacterium]
MREIVMVAMASIRANALRSGLTTLGIVIGTAAVITMVALGEGAQRQVQEQIENMGTNILTVRPGQGFFRGVASGSRRLEEDDALALRDQIGHVYEIAPEIESRYQVTYARSNSSNSIVGTWPSFFSLYSHELEHGRFFDEGEVQGRRRVAVLGSNVPDDLETPGGLLVGRTIQIRGIPFEVIGVLREKGGAMWMQPDDQIFIPLSTAMYRVMGGRDRLRSIYVAAPSPDELDPAWAEIDRVIRREHRILPTEEADFSIQQSSDILETFNETTQTFSLLLAGIAGVSLLVGGIGIMNIMLVSVTERTREIGVRKALGATRKTILFQFLVEALVLCVLGGILGVAGGFGAAELITRLYGSNTAVAAEAVAVALGFSAAIGLFFGIWPARRASILDPIDALRYE